MCSVNEKWLCFCLRIKGSRDRTHSAQNTAATSEYWYRTNGTFWKRPIRSKDLLCIIRSSADAILPAATVLSTGRWLCALRYWLHGALYGTFAVILSWKIEHSWHMYIFRCSVPLSPTFFFWCNSIQHQDWPMTSVLEIVPSWRLISRYRHILWNNACVFIIFHSLATIHWTNYSGVVTISIVLKWNMGVSHH